MMKITTKLVKVMAECGYVAKNGSNEFHRYKYATAADVLEKVNAALVKHGIAAAAKPELVDLRDVINQKGNAEHLATVRTIVVLTDEESGEAVEFIGLGSGQDIGDKAVMKAQTASIKYAYMLSLAISTGDDPEADAGVDERNIAVTTTSTTTNSSEHQAVCSDCGVAVTAGVLKVSLGKYKRPLCMKCQKRMAA